MLGKGFARDRDAQIPAWHVPCRAPAMLPWKSLVLAGALLAWSSSALAVLATPAVVVTDAGSACDLDAGEPDTGADTSDVDAGDSDAGDADAGEDAGCLREEETARPYIVVTNSPPTPHYDVEPECCGFRIAPRSAPSTAAVGGLAIAVALLGRRRRRR